MAAGCSGKRFYVASAEDYEEMCFLGKGGFGAVVKALHRPTGQFVAIKSIGGENGRSAVIREATFLEECRGIPYVVGFRGLVGQPGITELRLALEFVGPSLRDIFLQRTADEPPLREATIRNVMCQLLLGLKMMHERQIIHRDIKPGNILIGDDQSGQGIVKICDLGLALHMSKAPPYGQAGTIYYMAPEVLLGKTDYDAAVDAWSLGCVMAELIGRGGVLFKGRINTAARQLCAIIDVLGIPHGQSDWPWFYSTSFGIQMMTETMDNLLRQRFPETMLSQQGFEVLSGLLTWNPDTRLTASAALDHPWFDCYRAPAPAPELPQMQNPQMAPPNLHQRQKMQYA